MGNLHRQKQWRNRLHRVCNRLGGDRVPRIAVNWKASVNPPALQVTPEDFAYWYLRLNGFLNIRNFIVHPESNGEGVGTDADILGVRFAHRRELQRCPFEDEQWIESIGAFTASGVGQWGVRSAPVSSGSLAGEQRMSTPEIIEVAKEAYVLAEQLREMQESMERVGTNLSSYPSNAKTWNRHLSRAKEILKLDPRIGSTISHLSEHNPYKERGVGRDFEQIKAELSILRSTLRSFCIRATGDSG